MKLYIFFFIFMLVSSLSGGVYWYYTSTQATIALLRENNVKLKSAAEMLQATVDNMAANQALNEELNKELTANLQKATGKLDSLRKRFSQIDIVREAQTDPDGFAIRINRAIDRLREELRDETTTIVDPDPTDIE